jgi:UDP-N-acetylglucosamine acyltransferase
MIHHTAVIHPSAQIADGVEIGPYSIIGEDVQVGEATRIGPHVVIDRWTQIGKNCEIYQYASLGSPAQHVGYRGERTRVVVGDNNVIREYVTINRGTTFGIGQTVLGNHNFIMAYVHIAHDCTIGSNVIMASFAVMAGHVTIEDYAIIGGMVPVHQFVRIGSYAFIGGGTSVTKDIPPYVTASGMRAHLYGINTRNLQRRNFPDAVVRELKRAYKIIFRSHLKLSEAITRVEADPIYSCAEVRNLVDFVKTSERGITR